MSGLSNRIRCGTTVAVSVLATLAIVACSGETPPAPPPSGAPVSNTGAVSQSAGQSSPQPASNAGGSPQRATGAGGATATTGGPSAAGSGSTSEFPVISTGTPESSAGAPSTPAAGAPAAAGAGPVPAGAGAPSAPAGAGPAWEPGATCQKSIQCGGKACSTEGVTGGVDSPNLCITACCTADQKCGANVNTSLTEPGAAQCSELEQPGLVSEECGAAAEADGTMGPMNNPDDPFGFDVTFCCRPDNRCGLFLPNLGVGCAALDEIKTISPLFEAIDLPPMPCHYDQIAGH